MKSKYNTGHPIDINKLTEEERRIAFHEWAEGSPGLEKLLNEGYKKGFLSRACCAGHEGGCEPYIMYDLDDENSRKMAMSIAEKLVKSDVDCEVTLCNDFLQTEEEYRKMREHLIKTFPEDFKEENYSPTRTITRLHIQMKKESREEVFKIIAKYIKEAELDKVKLPKSEEEIPRKNFKENIKEDNLEYAMKQEEKETEHPNDGMRMIDEIVEESKKDIRQGEINSAIVEIKQMEKNYIQEQMNSEQFMENEPSIGG